MNKQQRVWVLTVAAANAAAPLSRAAVYLFARACVCNAAAVAAAAAAAGIEARRVGYNCVGSNSQAVMRVTDGG